MTIRSNIVVAVFAVMTLAAGLGGCASAGGIAEDGPYGAAEAGPGRSPVYVAPITGVAAVGRRAAADGVLDELPAHPPTGTCYARVKVINDAPPPGARAVWRLNPGVPGAMGPTWCLVLEGGQPAPPPPERFGWVKVLCDTDATPERVRVIQTRLRLHGDYHGEETGQYDQATADAVARFQQEQHIDHGGYLSVQTVEAIERADVRAAAATGGPIHVACCEAPPPPPPPPVRVRVPAPYPVRVEVPVPQPYPVYVPQPQPYPVRVEVPVPRPYPVYVPQPYPVQVAVPQPYPVYVPAPQPCCIAPPAPPCCLAPPPSQPCCQAPIGYGPAYGPPPGYGGYRPTLGREQGVWLTWPGKSAF